MKPVVWWGLPFLLGSACTGVVLGPDDTGPSSRSIGPGPSGGGGAAGGGPVAIEDVVGADPETLPDGVPPATRVSRLTQSEYRRTVADLLGLEVDVSKNFPEEQPSLGAYEGYADLAVNERLLNELDSAAQDLAAQVGGMPAVFANVVGCDPAAAGCRDTFIGGFGLRAFRRPLEANEVDRYRALFDAAAELVQSGDAFRDGVELVVEAMLKSPHFLYRIERGAGADADGVLLGDYEVASRLSYMLLGTMPDAQLFAAAAAGGLTSPTEIAEQASRLTNEPRFAERIFDFHGRWMQLDELNAIAKDPATYAMFSPALVASMRAETQRFIEEVVLARGGTIGVLLTSPSGFVDANLAAVYGLQGAFGSELTEVNHDASSARLGLFTQASFLAGHSSSSTGTSPILRGVFLLRRLACVDVGDPPPGAQMQQPAQAPAEEILTTRQYFTWKTSMQSCAGCHNAINPTGFAFEAFDGIGQYRTSENGAPIDATGAVTIGDQVLEFSGARELLEKLATLPQVRACYAKNWLQFAYGRTETREDLRALGLAARDMATATYSVRALATSLTERPAFFHLPPIAE